MDKFRLEQKVLFKGKCLEGKDSHVFRHNMPFQTLPSRLMVEDLGDNWCCVGFFFLNILCFINFIFDTSSTYIMGPFGCTCVHFCLYTGQKSDTWILWSLAILWSLEIFDQYMFPFLVLVFTWYSRYSSSTCSATILWKFQSIKYQNE